MEDLLKAALGEAITVLEKRVPQTQKQFVYTNIEDVSPLNLIQFMRDNGIPDTADFAGHPNGYDGFDAVCLCHGIDVPTPEKDKMKFRRQTFPTIAAKRVYDSLTGAGYKRVGFNSGLLKAFDDTTVYDMYVSGDFGRLVEYYSLMFVPI